MKPDFAGPPRLSPRQSDDGGQGIRNSELLRMQSGEILAFSDRNPEKS